MLTEEGGASSVQADHVLDAIALDDSFAVVASLSRGTLSMTDLVRREGITASALDVDVVGPQLLVRKRIPLQAANRAAWEALEGIDDPLLPRVRWIYELPDYLCVVSDYVEGFSVEARIEQGGTMNCFDAASLIHDVAHAASVLHSHGIIHRDITPPNVILAPNGAHLIDLGIARTMKAGVSHDTTNMGTWGFASPEQFGFAATDARSDVYSMGRLLAYVLTGVRPDEPAFERAVADPVLVPPSVREVIRRACAFEPSARYPSAEGFARAAETALVSPVPVLESGPTAGNVPAEPVIPAPAFLAVAERPTDRRPRWGRYIIDSLVMAFFITLATRPSELYDTWPWTVMWAVYSLAIGFFWGVVPVHLVCAVREKTGPFAGTGHPARMLLGFVAYSLATSVCIMFVVMGITRVAAGQSGNALIVVAFALALWAAASIPVVRIVRTVRSGGHSAAS